jgi:DNA-binding NarL/FixJ family response regulator
MTAFIPDPKKITLVIADDHPLVLDSLRLLFECVPWVGRIELSRDGLELWDRALSSSADAVVTDLSMPRLDGLSSIRRLRRRYPQLAIVAITGAEHYFLEPEVLEAGADAYLSKHRPGEEVVAALAAALESRCHAPGRITGTRVSKAPVAMPPENISEREREVLKLLAEGFNIDETADMLHVSPATIRKHREHLHEKLGTSNTARLTLIAVHMGLVES